ncbi:secreted RxLR effector protein 161-like [Cryptomeria japonica]|uniref:secreted RxLR effector protein 161-like n=1 Tax=Cryptomeria japonica TaxID=3369 RepID=UPI0027DA2667|nr:secreted RxLR effector protein 161-like [Cryptomeria japonica]
MTDCKPVSTPMETGCKLTKSDDSPAVNQSEYRSMIGSLLYLTASRLDLMFVVCLVSRFQSAPKQSHLNAVKRIFRYVQGTLDYGLWYPRNNDFTLVGFTNSDWAGCLDDHKSTSGAAFFLGDCLVAWHSKKQDCVTLSTAESEYIAATACCTQLIWMSHQITDMGISTIKPISIYRDNTSYTGFDVTVFVFMLQFLYSAQILGQLFAQHSFGFGAIQVLWAAYCVIF